MDLVRVGCIGLGNITQTRHLPSLRRIGGVKVVGGADINRSLLKRIAELNQFEVAHEDYNDLLTNPEIDAVFVNLPTHLHAEVTLAALEKGKHVFCEKPMAMNAAEARKMADAAREAGRYLMIGNVQRFAMRSRLMKQQVDSGTLGDVYYLKGCMMQRNGEPPAQSWFARREMAGGGVLMDQGPGMLDLVLWCLGHPEVAEISGSLGRFILHEGYDVEDFATLNFRAGDVNCHIELAWAHSHGPQGNLLSTDIFASKGGVRCRASWSNDGPPLTVFRRGAADQVSEKIINFTPADAHHEQDKHFIDSIRSERAPEYTPELALKVMEIIEMVYQQNGIEMCNGSSQLAAPTLMLND